MVGGAEVDFIKTSYEKIRQENSEPHFTIVTIKYEHCPCSYSPVWELRQHSTVFEILDLEGSHYILTLQLAKI